MSRSCASVVAAIWALIAPPAAPAAAPASAPDNVPELTAAELAPLTRMCQQLNQRRWGKSVVETFEQAPAKDLWTVQGKLVHKDARLTLQGNGMLLLHRPVPEALRQSEGVRVDAWLTAKPQQQAANMYYLSLFLNTENDPNMFMQWDFAYMFACAQNGQMQQLQSNLWSIHQGGVCGQMKADKLTHVKMEIVGQRFLGQRDKLEVLSQTAPVPVSFKVEDKTRVGIWGQAQGISLIKMVYRGLEPAVTVESLADQWKATRFSGQQGLTEYVTKELLPLLDAPRYVTRERAARQILLLWPLSKPAVGAAIAKNRFSPEGKLRLAALNDYAPVIKVTTTQGEDEGDKPPANYKDLKPSTQKDEEGEEDEAAPVIQNKAIQLRMRMGARIAPATQPAEQAD